MANKVYPKYKKACMSGAATHDLIGGNVKMALVDTGSYTYSDAHEFLSDIGASVIASSGNLSGKSISDLAAFQCANGRVDAATGVSVEAVVIYIDTGTSATSRLVAFIDTGITGMPVTPAGTSYNLIVDPSGVFIL